MFVFGLDAVALVLLLLLLLHGVGAQKGRGVSGGLEEGGFNML